MEQKLLFTSESVTEGHPDKLCDRISDAVLDAHLEQDPYSRVACETFAGKNFILVSGEITSKANVNIQEVVTKTILDIGYDNEDVCFDGNTCDIIIDMNTQSPDIAMGVDADVTKNKSIGAGDQGIMFGYACNETEEYMPLSIVLAHKLTEGLAELRKSGKLDYLGPDGKSQVTVEYNLDGTIKRIDTILISTQHRDYVNLFKIQDDLIDELILKVIPIHLIDGDTKILINPTGRFVIGGPAGDTGLTGRKIIVDTYGGHARHGGGAFSGKDCTKVDRSAAYMARYVAKNIVASGIIPKCEIQLAYAIGVSEPVSIKVDSFGALSTLDELELAKIVKLVFDFTPEGIIDRFNLRAPIYSQTSAYGHFGKPGLPWEKIDNASHIKYLWENNK